MKSSLALAFAVLLAACGNPTPSCPTPAETVCAGTCTDLQSDAMNCNACGAACGGGQVCLAGKCGLATCTQPDAYATCELGGGLVGLCSDNATQTPTALIVATLGDGGTGTPVVPELFGGLFTGAKLAWLLDSANNQIDVMNVGTSPPTEVVAIAAAPIEDGFSINQLASCDGMVLALRTDTPLLEGYDPATFLFINEVSLVADAGYQYPAAVACDGDHIAYVTDSILNTVTAIDLDTFKVIAQTTLPPSDQPAPLPDGGAVSASLTGVAFALTAGGSKVLVSLQNLDVNYFPAASSTTFEIDPALTTWSKPIDPGAQCLDAFQIVVSPDQLTAYLACTGILNSANATTVQPYNAAGYTGVIGTASASALPPIATTLSNPSSLAVLKNGLLAIGDYSPQSEVAFYNPADGGISYVTVNCPLLPDGGLSPQQAVTAVIAAP